MAPLGWWPVDRLIGGYLAAFALVIAVWARRIPEAPWLLALHAAGLALIWLAVRSQQPAWLVFRHWYPLPYVAACYKEMALLIPAIRDSDVDRQLAALDFYIWRAHPTVWLERVQMPWLTEFLQIAYSLFVPAVLLVAFVLWRRGARESFRQYAFLISLGFLVSYVGYLLMPARGPRFLLRDLQTVPLRGLWLFRDLQALLDRLESAHYDCFPSGHTELTMLAWWSSRRISKPAFRAYLIYTLTIVFATVYLRYHYTIDVLAGAAVAALLVVLAPGAYQLMGASDWQNWRLFRFKADGN